MKTKYSILFSAAIASALALTSCQPEEELNLLTFAENTPSLSIKGQEGASELVMYGTYDGNGELHFDGGAVSRTFVFNFAASPEDATVDFDIINNGFPADKVSLSTKSAVVKAGDTEVAVDLTLEGEDLSFAANTDDEATYELGVVATAKGYKVNEEPVEAKVVLHKEAYQVNAMLNTELSVSGQTVKTFNRMYANGELQNSGDISLQFSVTLDRPAHKDIKVKVATAGLPSKYANTVSLNPEEVVIPAGQKTTGVVVWKVAEDFLEEAEEGSTTMNMTVSIETEDKSVQPLTENNTFAVEVKKMFVSFGLVDGIPSGLTAFDRNGWTGNPVKNVSGNMLQLFDGNANSDVYTSASVMEFIVDMKEVKTVNLIRLLYYRNTTYSAAKTLGLSVSEDGENWKEIGVVDTPQSQYSYLQLFDKPSCRYIKFNFEGKWNYWIDVSEVDVY